jgi:dolichol-phosphate mannosyltransferase
MKKYSSLPISVLLGNEIIDFRMPRLSILIPVYNEAAFVQRCLENIVNEDLGTWKKEIIVVNDGSTDETLAILKKFQKNVFPIKIMSSSSNKGKGAAIKRAAGQATGEILIIQDADLEYDPNDYHAILSEYTNPAIAVVYGSRILGAKLYTNYSSHPLFYVGGLLLTRYINFLFGTTLTDQPTCYKSWRAELTAELLENCPSNGFEFEIEMTAHFSRKGRIVEVPIHYYPRALSHGKKIRLKDFVLSVLAALRCRFKMLPIKK